MTRLNQTLGMNEVRFSRGRGLQKPHEFLLLCILPKAQTLVSPNTRNQIWFQTPSRTVYQPIADFPGRGGFETMFTLGPRLFSLHCSL